MNATPLESTHHVCQESTHHVLKMEPIPKLILISENLRMWIAQNAYFDAQSSVWNGGIGIAALGVQWYVGYHDEGSGAMTVSRESDGTYKLVLTHWIGGTQVPYYVARRTSLFGEYADGTRPGDAPRPAGLSGLVSVLPWQGQRRAQLDGGLVAWFNGAMGTTWDGVVYEAQPDIAGYIPRGGYSATTMQIGVNALVGITPRWPAASSVVVSGAIIGPYPWTVSYNQAAVDPASMALGGTYSLASETSGVSAPPAGRPDSVTVTQLDPVPPS